MHGVDKEEFFTPPAHIGFLAKELFGAVGEIKNGSIAYLEVGGGGPTQQHTHAHDHLFIVVQGRARVLLANEEKLIKQNESFVVKGNVPHSVWNDLADAETVMIGITIK